MHPRSRAFAFAALPVAWTGLLVAVWHLGLYRAAFVASLVTLLYPASFGYAASLLLEPAFDRELRVAQPTLLAITAVAVTTMAYACSLYGIGSVLGLIPSVYKFGDSAVSLSRSTVQWWAWVTAMTATAGVVIRAISPTASFTSRCGAAAFGMSLGAAAMFVPLLAGNHVVFRR